MPNTAPDERQTPQLHIAVGVIRDAQGRVLISERRAGTAGAGLWEFPGGKCEAGETIQAALHRELKEELDIDVLSARPLIRIRHQYPDRHVLLDTWEVTSFQGEARGVEGQRLDWVEAAELNNRQLLEANRPLKYAAQLPAQYVITPDVAADEAGFLAGLEATLAGGARLLRLRAPSLDDAAYEAMAQICLDRCRSHAAELILDRGLGMVKRLGAHGLHLRAAELDAFKLESEWQGWLAASCHNAAELRLAESLSCHFAVLGPVQATASHPATHPLGWTQAAEWIDSACLPVYCIGGMTAQQSVTAWEAGAQGVAAIRGLWRES